MTILFHDKCDVMYVDMVQKMNKKRTHNGGE